MSRRELLLGGAALAALASLPALAADAPAGTLNKTPGCECCDGYAQYLRRNGIAIRVVERQDMDTFKAQSGIPDKLAGCHTTIVGGYVVEGHVPIAAVRRLLEERPDVRGISLPGMPDGSPGMTGRKTEAFVTYAFGPKGIEAFDLE
jgi:hypothetical protein